MGASQFVQECKQEPSCQKQCPKCVTECPAVVGGRWDEDNAMVVGFMPFDQKLSRASGSRNAPAEAEEGKRLPTPVLLGKGLHAAVLSRNERAAQALLDKGASLEVPDEMGRTPLFHAVCQCETFMVAKHLVKRGARVDAVDHNLLTPLHETCQRGDLLMTSLLLEARAHLQARDSHGRTPLHLAVQEQHVHIVVHLVQHGASLAARTNDDLTPHDIAYSGGAANLASYLERAALLSEDTTEQASFMGLAVLQKVVTEETDTEELKLLNERFSTPAPHSPTPAEREFSGFFEQDTPATTSSEREVAIDRATCSAAGSP
eukprot:TRINITY_DN42930_c0_g2_i2.p1 TRINITY_DN42930_c0_g2~~TRINITY_DN42930_c0_g2_i2.p1  ORF type:complete len:318 (+),score=68.78 TRINITY_DN42930_c0_g2_i2:105-1058(+)